MKKFFALLGVQAVMLVLLSFGANTTAYSQDYETINPSGNRVCRCHATTGQCFPGSAVSMRRRCIGSCYGNPC